MGNHFPPLPGYFLEDKTFFTSKLGPFWLYLTFPGEEELSSRGS